MYTDRKTTPLAYHNFIKYFSLPVSILACIAMLIFGIVNESWIGIAFSIPMLISLHDKVDELSEKYSSAQTSDRIKLHDEYVRGYEAGHDDGYNDGYVACDDEKEDQYEIGYDFAIESAVSSVRIYRESLQAAIYYNDRQTLNHLMTLDFRGYFMGW